MHAGGTRRHSPIATLISVAIVACGVFAVIYALRQRASHPSTDDATIDADLIHVAAAVGGRIVAIPVTENEQVAAGALLFQIDPPPYRLAVAQARADLAVARAMLATQGRGIATQQSAAIVAGGQITRARSNLDLANRTVARLRPLVAPGYVPVQQLDQAEAAARDAATSLVQAREQEAGARGAVDTQAAGQATVTAREAALAIAERALRDTDVRAPFAGQVVGLRVSAGEMVLPSQSLFTLVRTDAWFAVANLREFDLAHLAAGECATVYSMIDNAQPIHATLQGIGAGVLDDARIDLPRSVPYIERSMNWVRVAQRFPVRFALSPAPDRLLRLGASAVVEVGHGAACR